SARVRLVGCSHQCCFAGTVPDSLNASGTPGDSQWRGKARRTATRHPDPAFRYRSSVASPARVRKFPAGTLRSLDLFLPEDWDAVLRFARANGFTVVGGSRDALDLQLQGTVRNINQAFHVTMGVYQHPTENRTFFSPDREPTPDLSVRLWHISGLDNYSIPRPALVHKNIKVKSDATTGSCPGKSFCGSDMRAAYYGGTTLTGAGQNLGLLEFAGYDIADVKTYYKNANQTLNVTIKGISTDGTSLSCLASQNCDDTEQTIDITQAAGMAPNLTTLYVYVGSSDTALLGSMSTHSPLPAQLSSSWTWEPSDPSTDDPYFMKMASQGQNYFQA